MINRDVRAHETSHGVTMVSLPKKSPHKNLGSKGPYMIPTAMDQDREIEELRAKRKALFDWYEKNPNEYRVVPQIKAIDDEIAERTRRK
jgi:hypothetical protein